MCPLLAQLIIGFFSVFCFFLLRPFTVLMKKTLAVKQSIILRCLWQQQTFQIFTLISLQKEIYPIKELKLDEMSYKLLCKDN
jgi:hypothetical protein